MARTTYEISIDNTDHFFVTVRSDDPAAIEAAVPWTTKMYNRLTALSAAAWNAGGRMPEDETAEAGDEPPTCGIHHIPMVRMQGKHGPFWSCHQKNADGSFCSYKPEQV